MLAHNGWQPLILQDMTVRVAVLLAAILSPYRLLVVAGGSTALVIGSFAWHMITRPIGERTLSGWALTLAIPFHLGWPLVLVLLLRGDEVGSTFRSCGGCIDRPCAS